MRDRSLVNYQRKFCHPKIICSRNRRRIWMIRPCWYICRYHTCPSGRIRPCRRRRVQRLSWKILPRKRIRKSQECFRSGRSSRSSSSPSIRQRLSFGKSVNQFKSLWTIVRERTSARVTGRREDVAFMALALEGTIHVNADSVSAHSSLSAFVVIFTGSTNTYPTIPEMIRMCFNYRDTACRRNSNRILGDKSTYSCPPCWCIDLRRNSLWSCTRQHLIFPFKVLPLANVFKESVNWTYLRRLQKGRHYNPACIRIYSHQGYRCTCLLRKYLAARCTRWSYWYVQLLGTTERTNLTESSRGVLGS